MKKIIIFIVFYINGSAVLKYPSRSFLENVKYVKMIGLFYENSVGGIVETTLAELQYCYENDSTFYAPYGDDKLFFKVINGQWFYRRKGTEYGAYFGSSSNLEQLLLCETIHRNHFEFDKCNIAKKLETKCINGIEVYKIGVYNGDTHDLISIEFFAPKVGIIAIDPPYHRSAFTRLKQIGEYDSSGKLVQRYDFNLEQYYKEKYHIINECK